MASPCKARTECTKPSLHSIYILSDRAPPPKRSTPKDTGTPSKRRKSVEPSTHMDHEDDGTATSASFKSVDWASTKGDQKRKKWKNLKQILDMPTERQAGKLYYDQLDAPPSLRPPCRYCDITGLAAYYVDPETGLRYHSAAVYQHIKTLGPENVQRILNLRAAGKII